MAALRRVYAAASLGNRTIDHYRDLSDADVARLACLLQHQPPPTIPASESQHKTYRKLTQNNIKLLPPHLQTQRRQYSHRVCEIHQRINPKLMRSLLHWIQREVDVNIPALLHALAKSDCLTEEITAPFRRLREISGMWISPIEYQQFFEKAVNPRWRRQEPQCAACILARIGGEFDIVMALKAGLVAITSLHEISRSMRHKYVDALIFSSFDSSTAQTIVADAAALGAEIKSAARGLEEKTKKKGNTVSLLANKRLTDAPHANRVGSNSCPTPCTEEISSLPNYYIFFDDLIGEYGSTFAFHRESPIPEATFEGQELPSPPAPRSELRSGTLPISHAEYYPRTFSNSGTLASIRNSESTLSAQVFAESTHTHGEEQHIQRGCQWPISPVSCGGPNHNVIRSQTPCGAGTKTKRKTGKYRARRHNQNEEEETDLADFNAPSGLSASERAAAYRNSLDVDAFLRDLDEHERVPERAEEFFTGVISLGIDFG